VPFTLSHPAAVLPLRRPLARYAVLSALVVGSMAPDFVYYVGMQGARQYTHSLASIAWFSIPAGWLAYLGFQLLLRGPAVFLLPDPLRARLDPRPHIARFWPVTVSLAVGAFTHVVWDALTHRPGILVRHLPFLREGLGTLWGQPILSYRVLQNGSTLLGGAVVAAALLHWLLRTPARPLSSDPAGLRRLRAQARGVALLTPLLLGYAIATHSAGPYHDLFSFALFMTWVVVAGLSTLVVVLALLGVALRMNGAAPAIR
jgi:hypothetical protein